MKKIVGILLCIAVQSCQEKSTSSLNTYKPLSNAVIAVEIDKEVKDSVYLAGRFITNIPSGYDDCERFYLIGRDHQLFHFQIDRPATCIFNVGKEMYNVFLLPDDTVFLRVSKDRTDYQLEFLGNTESINNYYLKKKDYLGYTDIRQPLNSLLKPEESYRSIKEKFDLVGEKELSFLESYQESISLPKWFIGFETAEISYSILGFKIDMPGLNGNFKWFEDDVPYDYYSFMENVELSDESAVKSSKYLWFLDSYFFSNVPTELKDHTGSERLIRLINFYYAESQQVLRGAPLEVYSKYCFSKLVGYYSDSLLIDSLASAFDVKEYRDIVHHAEKKNADSQVLHLTKGDTIPNFYLVDQLDSLISIRDFKDKILYLNFWATWCKPCIKNTPQLNEMILSFGKGSEIKFINICMQSEKDKWEETTSQYQMEGVNLFAEGNWSKNLKSYFDIQEVPTYVILNKGNVLYQNHTDKAPYVKEELAALLLENN